LYGSKTLLKDILRDEWGFTGHVVSDCWALMDFHTHHMVTSTAPESAALALKNGCDVNCGVTYLHLLEAHQEGLVTEDEIARAATRLMATRIKLGTLDGCEYDDISALENDTDEHADLALEAARKSMVLLKNDGVLPLDLGALKTVAVIGPNANSIPALEGNYAGTSSRYVTFLEGVRAACEGKARVLYAPGCHLWRDKTEGLSKKTDDRLAEAISTAKLADVVILCVGLDASLEGEEGDAGNAYKSGDKENLELPPSQKRLIEAITMTGAKVVTVVASGSALRVGEGNAVLEAWYPGQAGGTALADILFGKVSPSGKLPLTFYKTIDDLPPFEDYAMEGRTYRYFAGEPLYPFGHGLSYTAFRYSDAARDGMTVSVTIENTGTFDADEVALVYVKCDSSFAPLNPRLCGFRRLHLKAGEKKRVEIALDPDSLRVVGKDGKKIDVQSATFTVGGLTF
jgi:beta-glucosidase